MHLDHCRWHREMLKAGTGRAGGLESNGSLKREGMPSKVSSCMIPPLTDHISSPEPFTGFSELMLHIEQIQKEPALLKRARLSLQFLKPFFHSSLLLLLACRGTPHPARGRGAG